MDISSADIICLTCYKAYKIILEHENEQSKDKDLQELMATLKAADLASVVDSALNEVTVYLRFCTNRKLYFFLQHMTC